MDHVQAAEIVRQAFQRVHGRLPSLAERQGIQSVGVRESSYGRGWGANGSGSFNWGSISAGKPPCGDGSFETTDSFPNDDGTSTQFQQCYRTYPDDVAGAADLVVQLTTRRPETWAAMRSGDLYGMAAAMRASKYYGSTGATEAERIANYVNPMATAVKAIAAANGEEEAITLGGGGAAGSRIAQFGVLLLGLAGGIAIASFVMPELEDAF